MGDELRLSAWFQLNNLDTAVTVERIQRLEAIARRRLRLDDSLVVRRRWAGMRPVTPDGVPIIGRVDAMAQRDHRRRPLDDRPHARPWYRPDRRPTRLRRDSRDRHRPLLAEEVLVNDTLTLPAGTLTISVVDSHTGGEPTRVVIDGFPRLHGPTLARAQRRSRRPASSPGDGDRRRTAGQRADGRRPADRTRRPAVRDRSHLLRPHPRAWGCAGTG